MPNHDLLTCFSFAESTLGTDILVRVDVTLPALLPFNNGTQRAGSCVRVLLPLGATTQFVNIIADSFSLQDFLASSYDLLETDFSLHFRLSAYMIGAVKFHELESTHRFA